MKVAVITGASQGIGGRVAAAYRSAGYAVVGTSRSIEHADEPDSLAIQGDIADPETATRLPHHPARDPADGHPAQRPHRQHQDRSRRPRQRQGTVSAGVADERRARGR